MNLEEFNAALLRHRNEDADHWRDLFHISERMVAQVRQERDRFIEVIKDQAKMIEAKNKRIAELESEIDDLGYEMRVMDELRDC
jgi:N-glycosylase/DNA lyase